MEQPANPLEAMALAFLLVGAGVFMLLSAFVTVLFIIPTFIRRKK